MPLFINTNVASINAQRSLTSASDKLNNVFARLSSGQRINTAADDAAGLAITNRMTSQIRGLTQAVRNANDGISVSQVAEGALAEDANMLQRINELAVQAANATNSDADRESLQAEVSQLLSEIERIAQATEFNNWPMLNGLTDPLTFQVGARESQTIVVELADARAETLLAQPVTADPNSPESVYNHKIEGMIILAPASAMANDDSKLFSAKHATLVETMNNSVNSTDPHTTIETADVATNLLTVGGGASAKVSTLASTLESAVKNAVSGAGNPDTIPESIASIISSSPTVKDVTDKATQAIFGLADSNVETVVNEALTDGKDLNAIADAIQKDSRITVLFSEADARTLAAATLASRGLNTDGVTTISGGGTKTNILAAAIAAETIRKDDTTGDLTITSDKARVIVAATYAAANPDLYSHPAISTAIGSATAATSVVDDGITAAGLSGTNLTNVVGVIESDAGNKSVEVLAAAAVAKDTTGSLTLDEARIVSAAGVAAAKRVVDAAGVYAGQDYSAITTAIRNSAIDGTVVNASVAAAGVGAADQTNVIAEINSGVSAGNDVDTIAAAAVAKDTGSKLDLTEAKIIAAAAKEAAKASSTDLDATKKSPPNYLSLTTVIANSDANSEVVDDAIRYGSTTTDVPVGNIMDVIAAFDAAISLGKDIETIAKLVLKADAKFKPDGTPKTASELITLEQAKIIAVAGMAATAPGGTVPKAAAAGEELAKVLGARDVAASAASGPSIGEKISVPAWLIDTTGQNSFPPTPLVDITGASIPTDPTLPFDPPNTNSTNPPLNGQVAAARMLDIVANAIDRVSSTRAELGALENRFTANIANLSNVVENVSAARSRILDADIAAETSALTRNAILQQAGTAVLAQANQQPQIALQLLG